MSKNAQLNWDDVVYVLAVADHGSVSAAARALSVNHATVLRHIAAFEARQGLRFFDKSPRGYQISPDRRGLIEAMREARAQLAVVDHMIDAQRPKLENSLRITSTDSLAQLVLPPIVADLSRETGAHVDLLADNSHLDFAKLEAHITVRPAKNLPDDLEGEIAGAFRFGVFATKDAPANWLGLSGPLTRTVAADWVVQQPGEISMTADSFLSLARLAETGAGRTLLPLLVGRAYPKLTCVDVPDDLGEFPIWVASHVDYAKSGRLVRARRFLTLALKTQVKNLRV